LPKTHNFDNTLPYNIKQQADIMLKDSYNFSFIGMPIPLEELELERRLVEKIKHFLIELGDGFSYMGNQYRLRSKETDFFVDLLFFNRNLKCLVAIDLKIGQFKPEYVGKMNFYLGLLDDQIKKTDENPSIGIILCADKSNVNVEVALRDINKPIGVAEYKLPIPIDEIKELIALEIETIHQKGEQNA
jgi:hypothetical protein